MEAAFGLTTRIVSGSIPDPQWAHLWAPKRKRVSTLVSTTSTCYSTMKRKCSGDFPATWTTQLMPRTSSQETLCVLSEETTNFAHETERISTNTFGFGGQPMSRLMIRESPKLGTLRFHFFFISKFSSGFFCLEAAIPCRTWLHNCPDCVTR